MRRLGKVKKVGMPPGPRASFSMSIHKKRAVLFGGVVDMEIEGDVLMSLFMNELYGFQLDTRRWYPLELRKDKSTKSKLKGNKNCEGPEGMSPSNGGNQVDLHLSITYEEDGNMDEFEEAADMQSGMTELSHQTSTNLGLGTGTSSKICDVKARGLVSCSEVQSSTLSEVVRPCGRINACMVAGKDTLYVYGGMMEMKDREITLDDLYSLNLSKLDEWKCIIPASESEWLEISEDEDDSDDEEGNSGSDDGETDDEEEDEDMETIALGNAVSIIRGEKKNVRRKEKRARIEQIRISLGLADSQRTPMPGESLKDFYKRTNTYWQLAAYEHTQHTGKELRKDGFDLAETRFKELKPVLDELVILEAEQKADEEENAGTSSKIRDTKQNKQRNTLR
ncbi:hypothetical protein KSP40_PGU009415 [Platanthera guangdongensis]|uniref:DUF4110 domain-containing protein n=1 Tax=Platanthera guangdongensis TaxID=2320717 RepID=A0ABR2LLN3_9ASPA